MRCHAAKGLECVFLILFTHCGRVWFTLTMPCPCPCHAPTCHSSQGHSTARPSRDGRAVLWPWEEWHGWSMAWAWHGMASVNQTRPHTVNQMGKTLSKPLAARHGRRTARARHGNGVLCVNRPLYLYSPSVPSWHVIGWAFTSRCVWGKGRVSYCYGRWCM